MLLFFLLASITMICPITAKSTSNDDGDTMAQRKASMDRAHHIHPTNLNAAENPADAQLLAAAFGNHVDQVQEALAKGANINVRSMPSGQTALMGATLRGHLAVVKFLLNQPNLDYSIGEKDGYTPVHGAAFQGRAEILLALMHHGLDVRDEHYVDGHPPLHRACWGRTPQHTEVVQVLRDYGHVDIVNTVNRDGQTCGDMTHNPDTLALLEETKHMPAPPNGEEEVPEL